MTKSITITRFSDLLEKYETESQESWSLTWDLHKIFSEISLWLENVFTIKIEKFTTNMS